MANLSGTGTGPQLNRGNDLIDGETVFNDESPDLLSSGPGHDWHFLSADDETFGSLLDRLFTTLGNLLD